MKSGAGRILVGAGLGAALIAGLLWGRAPRGPVVVSGQIEADEVRIGSRIGGRVSAVFVHEGEAVVTSQALVSLEPFDLAERIAEAQARQRAAAAHLARLEAGSRPEEVAQAKARRDGALARLQELEAGPRAQEIEAAQAALELAEAERKLTELERARVADLQREGTSSRDQLDVAQTAVAVARARVKTRRAELAQLREGSRREAIAQAAARLAETEAALELVQAGPQSDEVAQARWEAAAAAALVAGLERARGELTLRAALSGVVDVLSLQPGDLVAPNAPVATLRDNSRLWVRVYVPAAYLGRVPEGAELDVRVDGFEGRAFRARVNYVALQAEFTPSNVQSPEERQLQVFRVRLLLEPGDAPLRPGMSADVILADAP